MSIRTLVTDHFYAFMLVGGFIILGAVIAVAMLRNRTTPRQDRETEEATRRMYDAQARDDQSAR